MALLTNTWAKLTGLLGYWKSSSFDVDAEIKQAWEHCLTYDLIHGNAATNTTKVHLFYALRDMTVLGVKYVPDGTGTANATNYATMAVYSGNGAAAAATVVANAATTATSMAAGTPWALTLQTAAVDIDAGECLAADVLKAGTGLAVPEGHLVIWYRDR